MTEPKEVAERFEVVAPGLYHWRIHNSAIGGGISSSQALAAGGGCVLIDPVRLSDEALAQLPEPRAILLTARCHQRAAWRYRKQFDIEVWLPEDAAEADEDPDKLYAEGDLLPGGLLAMRTPGPEWPHYSFFMEPRVEWGLPEDGVLFVSDLIRRPDEGDLEFIPFQYHEDPAATIHSVRGLLGLPFAILCLDHGSPVTHKPKEALEKLLDRSE
jgi:hypothetical protein